MAKILKYHTFESNYAEHTLDNCPYRQGSEIGVFGLGSLKCERECKHCIKRDHIKHTVKCDFRVLDLSLTYHWYDEIESGRKTVEYREVNDWWKKRLLSCYNNCIHYHADCRHHPYCSFIKTIQYDGVRFHRGQGGKQTMMFECARIVIQRGHVIFGAPEDRNVFNIYLGKRLQ